MHILHEHVDDHFSVHALASVVGISERTLRSAFEQYFGVGPARYLKIRTLHQARMLLRAADPAAAGVTEIAVRLGYGSSDASLTTTKRSSASYLHFRIVDHTGTNPATIRTRGPDGGTA